MNNNLIHLEALGKYLLKEQLTIAVAESVTGGLVQASLSAMDKASFFFQGGITTYNLGQKVRHLGVEPIHAENDNSVSERVTIQMAEGVSKLFSSDIGIAITGYAAPLPEKNIFDLFAFYAIYKRGEILTCEKIKSSRKEFSEVQHDYLEQVLKYVTSYLTEKK